MLNSPLLQQISSYIDGKWINASNRGVIAVTNPANGEHLADVPDLGATETTSAVEAAARALLARASLDERARWLTQIHQALLENKHELARIITLEQGKPLKESIAEVEYAAGFFHFCAANMGQLESHSLPGRIRGSEWKIHHRPAGVVGLITPWNFPLAMLAKKFASAIAAGCAVVAKPADLTPLTCIALWQILDQFHLPAGRFNLVIGKAGPIGEVLCAHPAVRLISFTGSTVVGRLLMAQAAPYVKRLALELGGNAPFMVFDDADIEAAVNALMLNKFRCAGQTCVCANRVLVARSVQKDFTDAIAARVAALRVGDGLDASTDIGPLINRGAVEKVNRHVTDALSKGGRQIVEVKLDPALSPNGHFRAPVVLGDLPRNAEMLVEETFGPVVGITAFDSDEDAVTLANSTIHGLAAYVFTRNTDRMQRVVSQLRFGHVGLNTGAGPTPEAPFGGMKQSGIGREGGIEGMLEFCESQTTVQL